VPVRLSSPGYHKRCDRAVSPLPRKTHALFVSAATPSHLCLHRNHLSVRNNVGSRPVPVSLRLDSWRHDIASRRILRWTGRHPDSDPGSTPQFVPRRRPRHHRPNRPIPLRSQSHQQHHLGSCHRPEHRRVDRSPRLARSCSSPVARRSLRSRWPTLHGHL
jgi:hypothetical protein